MICKKGNFWVGVILIFMAHFLMDFMIGIWPVYKSLISLDLVVASLIVGISMFIGEGLQLYFGFVSDRGFHKQLICLGILLICTVPLFSYTENPWLLFIFVLSSFMGSGAFHPSAIGLLVNWAPKNKSFMIALFACGGMLGAAFSQSAYSQVYQFFSGSAALVLLAPLILILFGLFLFPFPSFKAANKQENKALIWKSLKEKKFELSMLYFIQIALQVIVISFMFLLCDILTMRGYEEWFCMGGANFCFVMGCALTSVPVGYCVDKFGFRLVLFIIILLSMSLLYFFLAFPFLPVSLAAVLLLCIGGTMGVITPVVVAGGNSLVPSYASSVVSSFYLGGVSCLAGFGPVLTSLIATQFQGEAPVKALQILGFLFIVALSLLYILPEPSRAMSISDEKEVSLVN
jgi:MFS transporter, FSR family, fosmidomycin resistance protein